MTAASSGAPRFEIGRITVVRASGELNDHAAAQLEHILRDLVLDHGVTDLLLDLTSAVDPGNALRDVVEATRTWVDERQGTFELRLPTPLTEELVDLASEVAVFAPLEVPDDS